MEERVLTEQTEALVNTKFAEIQAEIANDLGCEVYELEGMLYVRHPGMNAGFSAIKYAH